MEQSPASKPTVRAGLAPEHWLLIGVGMVAFVLLLLTEGRKTSLEGNRSSDQAQQAPPDQSVAPMPGQGGKTVDVEGVQLPSINLDAESQNVVDKLLTQLDQTKGDPTARAKTLSSLVAAYRAAGQPAYAAVYQDLLAQQDPSVQNQRDAGALLAQALQSPAVAAIPATASAFSQKGQAYLKDFLAQNPNDLDAQVDQALCLMRSSQPMQGIQQMRTLAQENPKYFRAQLIMGQSAMETGQLDKAETWLQAALKAKPGDPTALFMLALVYNQQGKPDEAVKLAEQARANAPAALKKDIELFLGNPEAAK